MNRTQINYAKERVEVIKNQHLRKVEELLPEPKKATWDEKIGEILSGKATLKVDAITEALKGPGCPYWLKGIFQYYDFNSEVEETTKQAIYEKRSKEVKEHIEDAAIRYLDQIVLDGKTAAAALDAFKKRKFI